MRKSLFGFNAKEVNETIDTLTNQNTALIQRNDRLEEDLKDLKMQLEESKVANEGLLSRAECSDYENIKSNFTAVVNENKQLNADIQNAKNAVSESQEALAQAQNEAAESKQALEQAQNEAAEYKQALEQTQNAVNEIKQACVQAQSEATESKQALEQVQNENYAARQELERVKEELNSAAETVNQLKSENAIGSSEELAKAQTEAYMAIQALEQERANTAAARAEADKFEEAVLQAQSLAASVNEQLEQEQNENMQLKLQLQTVQAQLEAAIQNNEKEAAAKNEVVSEYLNALQMACSKIDNSKGEIGEKMRSAIENFIDEWTNAENDLREMTAKVDEARMNAQMEFVNSTNSMLNALEQIEQYNSQMSVNINDIEIRKLELKEELEDIIDEFTQKPMVTDEDDVEETVNTPPNNKVNKPANEYIRLVSNR